MRDSAEEGHRAGPAPAEVAAAFARVATNVAVITTAEGGRPHGCTGNVWAESPAPPLVLVTLERTGETYRRVRSAGRFAVNLLGSHQRELAERFAQRHRDRFAGVEHRSGPHELPLLDGALSGIECDLDATHPFGAYEILVGRTVSVSETGSGPPLVFVDGAFMTTQTLP